MDDKKKLFFKKNWVTVSLIAVNVLVFLVLEIMGDTEDPEFIRACGGQFPPELLENGEYWRLISCTFLHFGVMHLLNNMILLGAAGQILENALGHFRYLLLYLAAGIGGSSLSFLQMVYSHKYAVAAGASGAIFGIIGALLWIVIINRGHYETLTTRGLLLMIALTLYSGYSHGGIDNWGHIGGLLGGFAFGSIFYGIKRQNY